MIWYLITAIKDLKTLLKLDLVKSKKEGRNLFYTPTSKVKEIRNRGLVTD